MQTASSPQWSSRIAFIFAAASAAIGLGNIWRFPYMLGQHGGGAFVLMYLVCVIILGIPLLIAEILLGRLGGKNPALSMKRLAVQSHQSKLWKWAGGLTVLSCFLILSYYVVIVGWVLDYVIRVLLGELQHVNHITSLLNFKDLQQNFNQMVLTDSVVVLGAIAIIYLGLKNGLERAVMLMFPALLVLLIALLIYATTTGHFWQAMVYLFKPDMHEVTGRTILLALGQAFFSLNVAMGITMMFSAYLPKKTPLISSAIAITIADTGIALVAGMVIFPIVFAHHLSPSAGPSLIFQTLPIAFSEIPFGQFIALLFFLMLFFAAFTSVLAMFEPPARWLIESCHLSRHKATWVVGCGVWLVSLLSIISFSHKKLVSFWGTTPFHFIDNLTATVMLPLGAILMAIFTGWFLSKKIIADTLGWDIHSKWFRLWIFMLKFIAPPCIFVILLAAIKVI